MLTHDHFLKQIKTQPDEDLPRLIYADWLEEQGDPRSELLRLIPEMQQCTSPERMTHLLQRQAMILSQVGGFTEMTIWEKTFFNEITEVLYQIKRSFSVTGFDEIYIEIRDLSEEEKPSRSAQKVFAHENLRNILLNFSEEKGLNQQIPLIGSTRISIIEPDFQDEHEEELGEARSNFLSDSDEVQDMVDFLVSTSSLFNSPFVYLEGLASHVLTPPSHGYVYWNNFANLMRSFIAQKTHTAVFHNTSFRHIVEAFCTVYSKDLEKRTWRFVYTRPYAYMTQPQGWGMGDLELHELVQYPGFLTAYRLVLQGYRNLPEFAHQYSPERLRLTEALLLDNDVPNQAIVAALEGHKIFLE